MLALLVNAKRKRFWGSQPASVSTVYLAREQERKKEREKEISWFILTYLGSWSPKTCQLPTAIFWFAHPKFLTIEHEACTLFGFLFLALEHRFDYKFTGMFCTLEAQEAAAEQKFKAKCFCSFQTTLSTRIIVL